MLARYNRLAKQKERGSKNSYVTQLENMQVILAWQAGEISEGVAARFIGVDRLTLRTIRDDAIKSAQQITALDASPKKRLASKGSHGSRQ